ncbi:phosphatase PAP2 family protein [Bifidobacterium mongoliense]|uniref:Acid phosphatase n=1 Tax=Bifidobacterium mongoliense DSM 21395 TaxID=1437603 RepID=A0A087C0A4_9BIFI|nr:phosphatase PAP2 family protein [Bifidobacterium mongoliense]KFI76704.1 acid phosphatase [Bifidobacterium mongoliense DSM 21395]
MSTQKSRHAFGRIATVAVASLAMIMGGAVSAHAEAAYPSDKNQPDLVNLLAQYKDYYNPSNAFNSKDPSSFGKGTVVDAKVLGHNDQSTQQINNAAAAGGDGVTPTEQQKRALIDSDYKMSETLPDALGSQLGAWFSQGLSDGTLSKTADLLTRTDPVSGRGNSLVADYLDTGTAKTTFNHPRPYVDRTEAGYPAAGLHTTLDIKRVPAWTDEQGRKHNPNYDGMTISGSFPSGHTTYAFSGGVGLATLFPQLGTEIVTRASEAGNNRIVLGVHYSLDIMGGRIDGEAGNTARWSDDQFRADKLMPAYNELQSYMANKCVSNNVVSKQSSDYDTVGACVAKLGANGAKGYANAFTDAVSTKPVTDRASAIDAYTARMSYGFAQDAAKAGQAAVVPQGAENLLLTAFPDLSDAQRRQVLAASESDSGYPLDASSQGYQRLNLAKAFSAKVVLSADKSTILSLTFGNKAPLTTVVNSGDGVTSLLTDFNTYWKAGVGVTDASKAVLKHDDELTESINNKAFAEGKDGQGARAVSDAQMNSTNTLYDALGPVLGSYYKKAMDAGKLPKTAQYLAAMNKSASTSNAKATYQHPRPYIDRQNYVGTTLNLNGLKQTLTIDKVPAYSDFNWGDGSANVDEYADLYNSGSFPSGHTTFAFTQGTGLASILPELGPEIMTRVSEAGNNRIVLGVHYPLDILGGHIAGQYGVATALNDDTARQQNADARAELVSLLTAQCKADKHGDTLQQCIDTTGANANQGYANAFVDEVSTKPVTDRTSAIAAYKARMSYGFEKTGAADAAPVVPDQAVNLLDNVTAFSALTKDQKKAVLAATEGGSGYPLDASSQGWARIDLAAAYSAKVTLSADGTKIKSVEPGQATASVVRATTGGGNAGHPGDTGDTGQSAGQQPSHNDNTVKPKPTAQDGSATGTKTVGSKHAGLATTGSSLAPIATLLVTLVIIGTVTLEVIGYRRLRR